MKVHVIWPIFFALIAIIVSSMLLYQKSWIPYYGEAEPLYPPTLEFGMALAKIKSEGKMEPSVVKNLLSEERFKEIQPYGIVFPTESDLLISIRINKRYSFDIAPDGQPLWKVH